MPNLEAVPTNFQRRINNYVPAMQYSADVNYNGETRVNFGAPPASNPTVVATGVSINTAGQADLSASTALVDPFGRNITVVASGPASGTFTVNGWDYLGQPVAEQFTLNGVTPVAGNKCFKSFNYASFQAAAAVTVNIGSGTKLGLPFKALRAAYEVANGVAVAAGSLQAANLIDPATLTTGEPRGAYTPTTTMNGANIISGIFNMANDVNTANHGGLHGLQHAAA